MLCSAFQSLHSSWGDTEHEVPVRQREHPSPWNADLKFRISFLGDNKQCQSLEQEGTRKQRHILVNADIPYLTRWEL